MYDIGRIDQTKIVVKNLVKNHKDEVLKRCNDKLQFLETDTKCGSDEIAFKHKEFLDLANNLLKKI